MRLRSDHQLFLSYLVLIAALTLTLAFGARSVVRGHLMRTIEEGLRREAVLGREVLETLHGAPYDSISDHLAALTGRRVTIVSVDGVAVGESAVERERPPGDDYRNRPEVRSALESGEGRAVRYSSTIGADHLYLAVRASTGEVVRYAIPLSDIEHAVADVQRRILAVALAAVLIAVLFSFAYTLFVTRPLRRTVAAARAMAAGDLSRRVPIPRDDDLGDLGSALNGLADELQRRLGQLEGERAEMQALIDSMSEGVLALGSSGRLRRANPAARRMFSLGDRPEGLAPEMISRRRDFLGLVGRALAGEAVPPCEIGGDGRPLLATAHPLPDGGAVLVFLDVSELRRLEGVRRDFVANASHELKTPLTVIRGYSETLLDPSVPPDVARTFMQTIRNNAVRLQRIVDDLLDLSRIEAGGWRIEPQAVDLAALAREVWEAQVPPPDTGHVGLVLDLDPPAKRVLADPAALRQILANLFGNSLRYTPAGGAVTVRGRTVPRFAERAPVTSATTPGGGSGRSLPPAPEAGEEERGVASGGSDWVLVEVEDTGSGIPGVHLSRIFERFYRADPARSREAGGTGLGLAIVKHLVEAHGGRVDAASEVGRGTTIRFTLPAAED